VTAQPNINAQWVFEKMEKDNNPSRQAELIPLFPLSQTVFYPNTLLPLHIFEPRYRQMMADALAGGRKIGTILLKPGWEDSYFAAPEVATVGCVGEIENHIRLEDGKYNMALKGLSRFKIVGETEGKPYRLATIERLPEINDQSLTAGPNPLKEELTRHCHQYIRLLPARANFKKEMHLDACKTLSHLTDQIANQLNLTVEQKQKLLEQQDVLQRVDERRLMLKMKRPAVASTRYYLKLLPESHDGLGKFKLPAAQS
jgi:Lon protease-like protein